MANFSKGIIVSDVDSIIKYINEIKVLQKFSVFHSIEKLITSAKIILF